jgi:outer membrane protein TolC
MHAAAAIGHWFTRFCLVGLVAGTLLSALQPAEAAAPAPRPPALTLEAAVHFAVENNPALAAQRMQHGIAAARVIIADTYPFNPILENRIQVATGPAASAGITNRLPLEHILVWEVEWRGQRGFRRQAAAAALSRTDWEIAYQEQLLAVQAVRAYLGLLYRQEKLRIANETLQFNQRLVENSEKLLKGGKLRPADLNVAQSEVTVTQDLVNAGYESVTAARHDLYRVLGIVGGTFEIEGTLECTSPPWDVNTLTELALTRRADLHARRHAVNEMFANIQLARANRFGNPSIGTAYTYDPSRVSQIGAQINFPLPLVNTRRGELQQSEAEYAQASQQLRQAEINVRQDVASAMARLAAAERRAETMRTKILPDLNRAVEDMDRLFRNGDVDLLRAIDVRRKLLSTRDTYLDVLWGVWQARSDVLAATGEPVLGLCQPIQPPVAPAPNK